MAGREPEVIAQVRAVDETLARRTLSPAASERIQQTLIRRAAARDLYTRLRWWPALAFVAGAALMAVSLAPRRGVDETAGAVSAAENVQSGPTPMIANTGVEPACEAVAGGAAELAIGDCAQFDGVEISAWMPAQIRRTGERVEVLAGEVVFTVAPRPGRPLHVIAGEVDIEVVGTRFVVHRDDAGVRVSLLEGTLRVRAGEAAREIVAGQQFEWSPAATVDPPRPPQSAGRRKKPVGADPSQPAGPAQDVGLAELLHEVAELRRAGQFAAAVARLRAAERGGWTSRSQQLVSYEIGALLERQLGDTAAACTHWQQHRREFPGGRFEEMVVRSIARLNCDD